MFCEATRKRGKEKKKPLGVKMTVAGFSQTSFRNKHGYLCGLKTYIAEPVVGGLFLLVRPPPNPDESALLSVSQTDRQVTSTQVSGDTNKTAELR